MIVHALLNIVLGFFSVLLLPLSFFEFPESVLEVIEGCIVYIGDGFRILAFYTHFFYLLDLLAIVLAVEALIKSYHFIMFILKKIPFLNIH